MAHEVELHMYDLSNGYANSLSWLLVGKQLDGVWHTSIVVFGKECYFGRDGIMVKTPGETDFGKPSDKVKSLGYTYQSEQSFYDHLEKLELGQFAGSAYKLMKNNCNTFSNAISKFLVGRGIPEEILRLPDDIWNGGAERLKQGAAIGSVMYSAYQVKQSLQNKNTESKKEENAGPSWLAIGGAIAAMATAGAAFSSFMSEEDNRQKRNSSAIGWRSNNYDSDSD